MALDMGHRIYHGKKTPLCLQLEYHDSDNNKIRMCRQDQFEKILITHNINDNCYLLKSMSVYNELFIILWQFNYKNIL